MRPNRHISLGWTPGCPSVPRTPVEEPGHAGDARKATGAMPGVPSRHRSMPSRHRGHALGAAHLNGSGNDSGLDSVTACDRGGGKRTWREHSRVLPTASMPPPPPPPSNESDEAEDKYLNACAAGVDSAEARVAMFRLEKLAQVALKV